MLATGCRTAAVMLAAAAVACTTPGPAPTVPATSAASPSTAHPTTPATSPTAAATPGARPAATPTVAGRAEHRVWVALEDAGRTVLLDLDSREIVAEARTPGGPHNLAVADDGTVAVALYGSGELAIVTDGRATVVQAGTRPHDVKPVTDGFVVADEAGRRVLLVGRDGAVRTEVPLEREPHDLDVTRDGTRAWVTLNGTDRLAVVDLARGAVVRTVPTGQRPHDLRIAPDGRIWITDWRGPLHVLSPQGQLRGSLELGAESHHLAFTPDGAEVWVTDHAARRVFVVDTAAVEVAATLAVSGAPHHVAITPDGALAAVADHSGGTVAVYDVAQREQVTAIPVGAGPHGVWPAP